MQTINIGYEKKNSTDDDCPERVSPFFGTTSKFALDIVKFKEIETSEFLVM